ncbi:MAG: 50S ribosomal protein L30 [Alicyclobacillus herbarius]|uniref:50S ribosomal protein L30 n=1 Tax=Alicyclobacillus herbarius TaxID=122960 RepID=UPI0004092DC5|nr:50S ribosomal protein L30 [Alicyclobacillus herbarius]MCL6633579.1 50S ribosomal protein L30 [Alicyclobacillus herbarius]
MANKLAITLKRSPIGRPEPQRRTVKALGLHKLNETVVHDDSPTIRGMINKVVHLVEVQVVESN